MLTDEVEVQCPCCWQPQWLAVDLIAGDQTYTEDCTVCCRPMSVRVVIDDDGVATVEVSAEA